MKRCIFILQAVIAVSVSCISCTEKPGPAVPDNPAEEEKPEGDSPWEDDGNVPDLDYEIRDYDGELAGDAAEDIVGTDEDIYWEANSFKKKISVRYDGNSASVSSDNDKVEWHIDGAHVVIDMQTNSVSGAEIEVSGKSGDGSLKIYGDKKFKLTLSGVDLSSSRGPAINSQCKKRVFIHLTEGSVNYLSDAAEYSDDIWYADGSSAADEDRKGCFFSEGNMIFSGTGVISVAGKQKHGIASDGYMYTRPGVTIAVTEAAKNAIQIKGDGPTGVRITGGYIYANTESEAGKCIKTDLNAEISGGKLSLNTSGNTVYDEDEKDTSSAAGIKADGDITISGGEVYVKSTGTGGKGLSADGSLSVTGGDIVIATSGGKYTHNSSRDITASPKGIRAGGSITVEGGTLNISVTGSSDGSEGIESKTTLEINGGEMHVYAYDDAINTASSVTVNGGKVYAYSVNNDGIDSNGTLVLNGGLVIASGSSAPEEAFDCDRSEDFRVNGGTLIGIAGASISPSSASTQRTVIYNGISAAKDELVAILDSAGKPIATCTVPRSLANGISLFFSSPDIISGATYTVSKGGTVSGASDSWNGWYEGGTWSSGTTVGTFTSSGIVTVVGSSNGPGGGPGGNHGGGPGGRPF